MVEPDYQIKFFIVKYVREFLTTPKVPMNKKLYISLIFSRLGEIPAIGILYILSKIPLIGPYMERAFAQKITKKWKFKPLPNPETLSTEASKFKEEKTVEINKKMDVQTTILDIATFNDIVEKFPFSSVSECGCRSVINHCDAPYHTCLTMKWPSDSLTRIKDSSKHKSATKQELERVIELADKHSLVHMALNYPDEKHTYVVCNCCDCCCISFREFKAHAIPMIVGSKYVARVDSDKCAGCFYCINFRCRFDAINRMNENGMLINSLAYQKKNFKIKWPIYSERRNGWGLRIRKDPIGWKEIRKQSKGRWFAKVDPNKCFGCGNCASPNYGCPHGAIKLYPRK